MAVEALCTVFTVPGIGQHRIDVVYLYGNPERPSHGCYDVLYDREKVARVWHDQDADHWTALMAKAARAVAATQRDSAPPREQVSDARDGAANGRERA